MKAKTKFAACTVTAIMMIAPVFSQNKIAAVRTDAHVIQVRLTNSDAVAGVQFSLRSSTDLAVETVDRGALTSDARWIVASYKANDTTMNVVIMGNTGVALASGEGVLVSVGVRSVSFSGTSHVELANVMVAGSHADSLGVQVEGAQWSNAGTVAAAQTFELGQNYPNPFNPTTQIVYHLNAPSQVRLTVHDLTGREVNRLVDRNESTGDYRVVWNSTDASGRALSSGTYFARLMVGDQVAVRKMSLMK